MKTQTHEMTVTVFGIDMTVEFAIHGKYYPETRMQPAEYTEAEILSVKVIDSEIDIMELLSDKMIDDIDTQIYENFEL